MKKVLFSITALFLVGCANRPYEPSPTVYAPQFTTPEEGLTQVRVHRVKQITGSGLGEGCPLVLSVDNIEAVGLQQNQYADLYLSKGHHKIKVRFPCAFTDWSKSLDVNADGNYQEYETELGGVGQYRMWKTK